MRPQSQLCLLLALFLSAPALLSAERPRVGLALSGGGAKGLAHIGVLKVIEEAGLPIDIVTGTSMGAVVGGLYAIGHTVDDLEQLALKTDWVDLFDDTPRRRNMAMQRKIFDARYMAALPLQGWRVSLPSGLLPGQKVSQLLTRLTQPVHGLSDFTLFPRPFSCVATNLMTGEAVVLDQGFLPEAIRASMAIPSVFTPLTLDSLLLIDGFIGRNLPAEDARRLGAEIVIGVDVETPLDGIDEVQGLVDVINQTMWFAGVEENQRQRALCDRLIRPDVKEFSIMDFFAVKEIIARGERAARARLPELRKLADSLAALGDVKGSYTPITPDSLFIARIEFEGLDEHSRSFCLTQMDVRKGHWAHRRQVAQDIDRLYSTQFFERVSYRLDSGPEGTILQIKLIEKPPGQMRFGFRYDSQTKVSALLNLSYANLLLANSLSTYDLRLGQTNSHEASYFVPLEAIGSYGARLRGLAAETKDQALAVDSLGLVPYDIEEANLELMVGSLFSTSSVLGLGLRLNNEYLDSQLEAEDLAEVTSHHEVYSEAFLLYFYDNLNRFHFPTEGGRLLAEIARSLHDEIEDKHYTRWNFEAQANLPMAEGLTLRLSTQLGEMVNPDFFLVPYFEAGGDASFFGADFGGLRGDAMQRLSIALQAEPVNRLFVTAQANSGRAMEGWRFIGGPRMQWGGGFEVGYLTPFGPILWQIHRGSRSGLRTHLQVGYNF